MSNDSEQAKEAFIKDLSDELDDEFIYITGIKLSTNYFMSHTDFDESALIKYSSK